MGYRVLLMNLSRDVTETLDGNNYVAVKGHKFYNSVVLWSKTIAKEDPNHLTGNVD